MRKRYILIIAILVVTIVGSAMFLSLGPSNFFARARVVPPPVVSVSPTSWTMNIGQSEVFLAFASGGSGTYASYQWYVDGVAQIGETTSTFTYSPLASGSYLITVTVTDRSEGTSAPSSASTILVNPAPVSSTDVEISFVAVAAQTFATGAFPSLFSGTILTAFGGGGLGGTVGGAGLNRCL